MAPIEIPITAAASNLNIAGPERFSNSQSGRGGFRLPSFSPEEPALWFAQVELSFNSPELQTEGDRFRAVATALPMQLALEVSELIYNPPTEQPYTALKNRLLQKLQKSEKERIRSLIDTSSIPCATAAFPSTRVLREIRKLAAGVGVSDAVLKELFLAKVRAHLRPFIVATSSGKTLEEMAELADTLFTDSVPPHSAHSASLGSVSNITLESVLKEITNIAKSVAQTNAQATAEMSRIVSSVRTDYEPRYSRAPDRDRRSHFSPSPYRSSNNHGASRNRSSQRSASRSRSDDDLCWYHQRFGDQARKCVNTCPRFSQFSSGNANNDVQ
jgi:hypothetical protein